jgi:hypothetical protein
MMRYFGVAFEELFEVVLVDPERSTETPLAPRKS